MFSPIKSPHESLAGARVVKVQRHQQAFNPPFYRTSNYAGLPKGSYTVPNPRHFHIVCENHVAEPLRPLLVKIGPNTRPSPHYIFNRFNLNYRNKETITINIGNLRTVSLGMSLQTANDFIVPFANALNMLNGGSNLNHQECQTSYVNLERCDDMTDESTDGSELEKEILKKLQKNLLFDLTRNDDESDSESQKIVQFDERHQLSDEINESLADLPKTECSVPESEVRGKLQRNLFTDLNGDLTSDVAKSASESRLNIDDFVKERDIWEKLTWNFGLPKSSDVNELTEHVKMTENVQLDDKVPLLSIADQKMTENVDVDDKPTLDLNCQENVVLSDDLSISSLSFHDDDRITTNSSPSIDEGIGDLTKSESDRIVNNWVLNSLDDDDEVAVFGRLIFDYLSDQGFEQLDLVIFPEILLDLDAHKLLNHLKEKYDEVYGGTGLDNVEKNDLRLAICDYVLNLVENDEIDVSGDSLDPPMVSDRVFSTSEVLATILDHFFDMIDVENERNGAVLPQNGGSSPVLEPNLLQNGTSSPISKQNGDDNIYHSTPDKDDSYGYEMVEEVSWFKKDQSEKSELYWFSIGSPVEKKIVKTPTPRKIINVDDIPLPLPKDMTVKNTKTRFLSPIVEEPCRNLSLEFTTGVDERVDVDSFLGGGDNEQILARIDEIFDSFDEGGGDNLPPLDNCKFGKNFGKNSDFYRIGDEDFCRNGDYYSLKDVDGDLNANSDTNSDHQRCDHNLGPTCDSGHVSDSNSGKFVEIGDGFNSGNQSDDCCPPIGDGNTYKLSDDDSGKSCDNKKIVSDDDFTEIGDNNLDVGDGNFGKISDNNCGQSGELAEMGVSGDNNRKDGDDFGKISDCNLFTHSDNNPAGVLNGPSPIYVAFDKPETNVVVCSAVTFHRTLTTNVSSYVQSEAVVFSKVNNVSNEDDSFYSVSSQINGICNNEDEEGDWMGYEKAKF